MQPFAFWQCLSLKTDKMSHYFLVKRLVCNQNKYMLFYYLLQQKKCISYHGNGDCWRLRRSRHFTYISIDWCVAIAFNFNKKVFFLTIPVLLVELWWNRLFAKRYTKNPPTSKTSAWRPSWKKSICPLPLCFTSTWG